MEEETKVEEAVVVEPTEAPVEAPAPAPEPAPEVQVA